MVQAAASAYRKLSEEAAQAAAEEAEREAEASPDDGGAARRAALAQEANETLRERIEARRAQSKSSERLAVSPTEPEAMRQPLKNKAVAFSVNVKQVVALVSRGYRVCVLTTRHFCWAIGRQDHRRRRRPVSCPA